MTAGLGSLARWAATLSERVVEVSVNQCYHYRGFRYGGFGHNPYEDFIAGLARNDDLMTLRQTFAELMLRCRPRGFAAALQIDVPSWPLWEYPWQRASVPPRGEVARPEDNPDILTHYCEAGVLSSQINREFGWLEGAWHNIKRRGYRPRECGFITCMPLRGEKETSYIVLDGNHRLSSLHAMGAGRVEVKVSSLRTIYRSRVLSWPRVQDGSLSATHALAIFDRYFWKWNPPLVPQNPARLLIDERPLWPCAADRPAGGVQESRCL